MPNQTPLYDYYLQKGLKLIEFGGWLLPVQHDSIFAEHDAVRNRAGLFDVSHMGQVFIEGPEAVAELNRLVSNDIAQIADTRAQYNLIMNDTGGVIDDSIVFRFGAEKLMVVTNAANTDNVLTRLREKIVRSKVRHVPEIFKLDLQGPEAPRIAARLFGELPLKLKYFQFGTLTYKGRELIVSRSGYTGEHGYEIWGPAGMAVEFWKDVLSAGQGAVCECGLGARDTLRLEAALPLYGHELGADVNPFEAGLGKFVALEKPDFASRAILEKIAAQGPARELVLIVMEGKAAARAEHEVLDGSGKSIGRITSGAPSPTVGKPIAMAFVRAGAVCVGDRVSVKIRKNEAAGTVVKSFIDKRAAKKIVVD